MALTLDRSIPEKSVMPPGGDPRDDAALMGWAATFAEKCNTRWLDLHFPGELPSHDLLTSWQLIYHLYKTLIGWEWPDGTGPSRAHRIRFVAIQYRLRRAEIEAEAKAYARHLYERATSDGGGTRTD